MDLLNSILYLIGVSYRPRPRPIALESSALGKLPPELILYIARLLPPASASSFSLCCRPIYFILGTQYLKALEVDDQSDRYQFLTLLERELPNHILCYYCKKFHEISKAYRHVYSNRSYYASNHYLECWIADLELTNTVYLHRDFSFTVFQMAMKLYRQSLGYSKLLTLLSYKSKTDFRYGNAEQCSALARIEGGSLLFREQKIFMAPPTRPTPIPWDTDFIICPHIRFASVHNGVRYRNLVQLAYWRGSKDRPNLEGLTQCNYCLTEFRIDYKKFEELGSAMFVIKWQDLGEGRSPLDHKWQSHVAGCKGPLWLPVEFVRGSICAAFEGKEHSSFEFDSLLTTRDKKELFRTSRFSWPENE